MNKTSAEKLEEKELEEKIEKTFGNALRKLAE